MKGLRWTTAGESHGPCLIAVLEGMPAGLELDLTRVDAELLRRQAGYGRGGRMKIETDRAELLSGTRAGKTLGSPIALRVHNKDATIERLPVPGNPRPGHADLAGCQKYGVRDPRAVLERASARETAARVALAGVARQVLEHFGVEVFAHVVELGGIRADGEALERAFAGGASERVERRAASPFLALDTGLEEPLKARVDEAKQAGDTLGGVFEIRASGLPPGLGSYQSGPERLTARLGAAVFSIPAIKGVEFGLGFEAGRRSGSEFHDAIEPRPEAGAPYARSTNRAGGLEGGMTTGEPLVVRAAMKPIPSLRQGMDTVDFASGEPTRATYQRSDVTSVPACSVVAEAMIALELASAVLEKFPSDSLADLEAAWSRYTEQLGRI